MTGSSSMCLERREDFAGHERAERHDAVIRDLRPLRMRARQQVEAILAGERERPETCVSSPRITSGMHLGRARADREAAVFDVMRGEETQVFGALAFSGRDGLYLLPGTHSKWAEVASDRIVTFRTFMTGEVFAALKGHTILGRLMRDGPPDAAGFERGVREGAQLGGAGSLLNRLFATRTYNLTGQMADTALSDYLSGLLIGAEIAEATQRAEVAVTIVASPALAARYREALGLLGCRSELAPADCVAAGHWRIAVAAGLVKEGS